MPVTHKPAADEALAALIRGAQNDPFAVLGPHANPKGGFVVRAFRPAARSIELRLVSSGELVPMDYAPLRPEES
jgi:1,4-alpha-glucan branching enzyme